MTHLASPLSGREENQGVLEPPRVQNRTSVREGEKKQRRGRPVAFHKCRRGFTSNSGTRSTITNRFQKTMSQFIGSEFERSSKRKILIAFSELGILVQKESGEAIRSLLLLLAVTTLCQPDVLKVSQMKVSQRRISILLIKGGTLVGPQKVTLDFTPLFGVTN